MPARPCTETVQRVVTTFPGSGDWKLVRCNLLRAPTSPRADVRNWPALAQAEARRTQELRRPDETEIRQGIRYAVTPLFAATITT